MSPLGDAGPVRRDAQAFLAVPFAGAAFLAGAAYVVGGGPAFLVGAAFFAGAAAFLAGAAAFLGCRFSTTIRASELGKKMSRGGRSTGPGSAGARAHR
jgi:hypothetical protein